MFIKFKHVKNLYFLLNYHCHLGHNTEEYRFQFVRPNDITDKNINALQWIQAVKLYVLI